MGCPDPRIVPGISVRLMPKDQMDRVNLDYVYPPFLERVAALLVNCNARGHRYVITEAHRSYERSAALKRAYDAGGPRASGAGQSNHNFGLGIDIVLDVNADKPGVQLGPNAWKEGDYKVAVEEATKLGLKAGATYKDFPHFEWPVWISARDLDPLDLIYRKTPGTVLLKLRAVWQYCDFHLPNLPVIK